MQIEEPSFPRKKWDRISYSAQDLLSKMLERDPKQRISLEDCLKHSWFSQTEEPTSGTAEGKIFNQFFPAFLNTFNTSFRDIRDI